MKILLSSNLSNYCIIQGALITDDLKTRDCRTKMMFLLHTRKKMHVFTVIYITVNKKNTKVIHQ